MEIEENLFWGLVLKPGKRYEQAAPGSLHVSKACVEPQSVTGGWVTRVYLKKEGGAEEFLLCSLSSKEANVTLDLNFGYGEKVCFRTSGPGRVHLSGYLRQDESQPSDWESDSDEEEEEDEIPKRTIKGGIVVEDVWEGNGPEAKRGMMVGVYYEGRLKGNKKKFDACQSGKPFKFRLGHGEVIKGWDLGVEGMKVGGKRRLTIPANMAWGDAGDVPDIPPKSTVEFDVEFMYVNWQMW